MWSHPGKKLLFMGGELGVWREWNHDAQLDWSLLERAPHRGVQRWIADLNRTYRAEGALHERDFTPDGFEWVVVDDTECGVVAFLRKGRAPGDVLLCVLNLTPMPRDNYRVGVPRAGHWQEILNSDALIYGGSGRGNFGGADSIPVPAQGRYHSLNLSLPPLAMLCLKAPGAPGTAARPRLGPPPEGVH
jgi:1,4-alpha-glucan branching enzyme